MTMTPPQPRSPRNEQNQGGEAVVEGTAHRIPFRCAKCSHEWEEEVTLPMQVDGFLARGKGWCVCPRCGGKRKVYMLLREPNPFYKKE